ncbi:hypothetical protein LTR09_012659 [Extremus antarcticus]|uniref:Uncharacterized protein n=1 Tax=Extremus antarcticus TaxID=702011 RepID=A0AAJ0D9H6_9PEZI|nr:hypothetical protein LTR09_012659 [Extremus antarcticus]
MSTLKQTDVSRDARPHTAAPTSPDVFNTTTKGAFEDLIAAAKVLASSETIGSVVSLFDKIPDLEASIRSKDEQIQNMDLKMEKEVEKHKTANKESLLTYDAAKDDLKSEVADLKALVTSLQSKIEEKDAAIETLKTDEADFKARSERFKAFVETQKEKVKKSAALVAELKESVKESKADQDKLQDDFQKQQNLLSQSEVGLKRSQNEYEILRKEYSSMSRQLEGIRSLTISLSDGDPIATIAKLDDVWLAVSALNQVVWSGLKQSRYDELALPIPQSNTNAAKQMRCVAIMANIARAIDTYILQPTDFLPSNGGLRGLLVRQAQDEIRKEAAFRAMIQALLPTQQDTAATSRIAEACDNVMHDIGGLLPREAVATFKGELTDIVENTHDIWRQVRQSKDAVEPSFVLTHYSDWYWHQLQFEGDKAIGLDSAPSTNTGMDEPLFAVFPQFNLLDEEGQGPVTHGLLLTRSLVKEARRELDPQPSSPRVGRSNSILARLQRPRGVSLETYSGHGPEAKSFLEQQSSGKRSDGREGD